jgi:cell wall assembly regulator SMI1
MQASDEEQIIQAVHDIEEWMTENGAESFVAQLRPGADEAAFARAEAQLGQPLGSLLRTLYALHDGQTWQREREPFFEHMFFLDLAEACRQRATLLNSYFRPPAGVSLQEYHRPHAHLSQRELASEAWFPFANTEGDYLAVNLESGRVVRVSKGNVPWIELEAPDLATFLGEHASRLWDGAYRLLGDPALPGVEDGLRWLGRYFARG